MSYMKSYEKLGNKIQVITAYNAWQSGTYYQTFIKNKKIGSAIDYEEKDFLKALNLTTTTTGFMPAAIRYFDISNRFLVFESIPQIKRVNFSTANKDNVRNNNTDTYDIAVPWQVYMAYFDVRMNLTSLYIYYSNGPIESFDHTLYQAPLLNVYSNGLVCLPNITLSESDKNTSPGETVSEAIERFWESSFNNDLYDNLSTSCLDKLSNKNPSYSKDITGKKDLYKLFSSMSLDEIMEFNFISAGKIQKFIPKNHLNYSNMIQQLTLRNC